MRKTPFIGFLLVSLVLTVAGLSAVATFNLLVDPWRAYRVITSPQLDRCKDGADKRIAKAELVNHGKFDVLLLGTSCAIWGLDPKIPAWKNQKAVNLGVYGCSPYEMSHILQFALENQKPASVLLGLHYFMFAQKSLKPTEDDFSKSLFNPGRNILEYHFENLLGLAGTDLSYRTIKRFRKGQETDYDLLGFCERDPIPVNKSMRELFVGGGGVNESDFDYDGSRLKFFRQMISDCRENGTHLDAIILPVHAYYMEAIYISGKQKNFNAWLRDLATEIQKNNDAHPGQDKFILWDFSAYSGRNAEKVPPPGDCSTRMKWFIDPLHFSRKFGDLIIERIMQNEYPTTKPSENKLLGVIVTPRNIEEHLRKIWTQRDEYFRTKTPHEIDAIGKLIMGDETIAN